VQIYTSYISPKFGAECFQNLPDFWNLVINSSIWQPCYGVVATSPVVLHWLYDSPRTGCAWRTTPYIYVARTSNNRVIMACELHYCLLPRCEALRICRSGYPIATVVSKRLLLRV